MECLAMGQGDRIRTFIHGFDDKLGGGIPEGHVVLLAGEPGTMKSTIAFNMIYETRFATGGRARTSPWSKAVRTSRATWTR